MTIDRVLYSPHSAADTANAAANTAFKEAFDQAITNLVRDDGHDPVSNRFRAIFRRQHTHTNSFNPIIQFAIRSNMDIKVLPSDSDSKGILYYIMQYYSTNTEMTLDVLLPLLNPVVGRIREESDGATDKERAVRLVRSCLCKQLSSLNIGGPAAASKVLDLPDHKISHATITCPMSPLLAWVTSRDGTLDADTDEDPQDSGVIITPSKGKLTVAQRTYLLYQTAIAAEQTILTTHFTACPISSGTGSSESFLRWPAAYPKNISRLHPIHQTPKHSATTPGTTQEAQLAEAHPPALTLTPPLFIAIPVQPKITSPNRGIRLLP